MVFSHLPSRKLALLALLAVVGVVAACTGAPPQPVTPRLTYDHLGAIRLDVAEVKVVEVYVPPLKAPNVEHEFAIAPAGAARRWFDDRLEAAGTAGLALAVVREASVVEVPLKKTTGVTGLVTQDQSERYDAKLVMEIEIRNAVGDKEAFVRAVASRSRTVPEGASVNDREKVYFELTEALMNDINAQLENQINQHFARYLR